MNFIEIAMKEKVSPAEFECDLINTVCAVAEAEMAITNGDTAIRCAQNDTHEFTVTIKRTPLTEENEE